MDNVSGRDFWGAALVYAPIIGFTISTLVSLCFRVVAGKVVRISRLWAVVLVPYGIWICGTAILARGVLLPYTGVGGELWANSLAYILVVLLFLGLPFALFSTIIAIGAQYIHVVTAMRGKRSTSPYEYEAEARNS